MLSHDVVFDNVYFNSGHRYSKKPIFAIENVDVFFYKEGRSRPIPYFVMEYFALVPEYYPLYKRVKIELEIQSNTKINAKYTG